MKKRDCDVCGAELNADDLFCMQCGAKCSAANDDNYDNDVKETQYCHFCNCAIIPGDSCCTQCSALVGTYPSAPVAPAALSCGQCGSPVRQSDKFCDHCGAPQHSASAFGGVRSRIKKHPIKRKHVIAIGLVCLVLITSGVLLNHFSILPIRKAPVTQSKTEPSVSQTPASPSGNTLAENAIWVIDDWAPKASAPEPEPQAKSVARAAQETAAPPAVVQETAAPPAVASTNSSSIANQTQNAPDHTPAPALAWSAANSSGYSVLQYGARPDPNRAQPYLNGTVLGDRVNFRSGPSTNSNVLDQFDKNMVLRVTERFKVRSDKYYWYKASYNGQTGWIYGQFINVPNP